MIYLDYQATTPLAPEAVTAMRPWLEAGFGNPHSPHRPGREAAAVIDVARENVLRALGSSGSGKLFFTSGATEAANWALKGAAARLPRDKRKILALATEHACVLDSVEWLGSQGYETEVLPVGADGLVDLDMLASRIDERTGLVAAMLVNNEIGVVQPVAEIAHLAHARGALYFCDAVQGFGRVPLPLDTCDMVAISAHKVHGPKGIGRALGARWRGGRAAAAWRRAGGRPSLGNAFAGLVRRLRRGRPLAGRAGGGGPRSCRSPVGYGAEAARAELAG
jgi:cysteine desulfurase